MSANIVYKKNAYDDLKFDLQSKYYNKKVFIITTKSLTHSHLTQIMSAVSMAGCEFKYFVAKHNFSLQELKKISEVLTMEAFDLFICFGAGKTCDVTKYFANIFCVPYFVCPSACSSISYFNNICINPYDSTRSFVCDRAEKVYIEESVIKTTPRYLVKQGVYFIMSLTYLLCNEQIEHILLDKPVAFMDIEKDIDKLNKELRGIMTGDGDSKLILMDILIDVAEKLKDVDVFSLSLFNLYCIMNKINCDNEQIVGAGEIFLLSAELLFLAYKNLFSQKKIKRLEVPNFPKIAKNIKKFAIFYKKIHNFAFFNDILSRKDILLRLNNLKEEFLYQTQKRLDEIKNMMNLIKRYENVFSYNLPKIKDIFTSFSVLPFVCDNNYIVSLMGGIGICNVM